MSSYFKTLFFCAGKKLFIISFSSTYQFVHFCICIMFAPIGTWVFYDYIPISISMVQNFLMIAFSMFNEIWKPSDNGIFVPCYVALYMCTFFLPPYFVHSMLIKVSRLWDAFPLHSYLLDAPPFFSNDISHTFYDQLAFSFPHRISISTQHPFLHLLKFYTPHSNIYAP